MNWGPYYCDLEKILRRQTHVSLAWGSNCSESLAKTVQKISFLPHFSERIIWKIQLVPKNPWGNVNEPKNESRFTPSPKEPKLLDLAVPEGSPAHLCSLYLPESHLAGCHQQDPHSTTKGMTERPQVLGRKPKTKAKREGINKKRTKLKTLIYYVSAGSGFLTFLLKYSGSKFVFFA